MQRVNHVFIVLQSVELLIKSDQIIAMSVYLDFHLFLTFLQNKKSPYFLSFGSHSFTRLHIFLLGLYSYEQQSGFWVQFK